jgi:hypothetical protein
MDAQILHIQERSKVSGTISIPQDFTVTEGEPISPRIVLDNPDVSLYCLDDANQRALFCELPSGTDLSLPPFYYQEQFERARRLIAVPYQELHALARTVPEPERLILIVNMGRCGSTLLSKAINQIEGVTSYSEPDVYTQIVQLRDADRSRDTELADLMQTCTRLICRPPIAGSSRVQTPHTYAIKFRSPCTEISDLLYRTLPQASYLFVYRSAIDWVGSYYRVIVQSGAPPEIPTEIALTAVEQLLGLSLSLETIYGTQPPATLRVEEALALSWPIICEHYVQFYRSGIPFAALRYEDLKAEPRKALTALLKHCDLPADRVSDALAAFEQDSQQGSFLGRERADRGARDPLNKEQIARVRSLLARHPTFQTPDIVLPGTLQI